MFLAHSDPDKINILTTLNSSLVLLKELCFIEATTIHKIFETSSSFPMK